MATYAADSAELVDVESAIALASDGDTVTIPEDTATWTDYTTITHRVNLIGAGSGKTVITGNWADGGNKTLTLIRYEFTNTVENATLRISGLGFDCQNKCGWLGIAQEGSAVLRLRVDHNNIDGCDTRRSIIIQGNSGPVYGVGDNNTLTGSQVIYSDNETTWTNQTFAFGSADQLYFEDNILIFNTEDDSVVAGASGRYCYRHNTIIYNDASSQGYGFDAHGNQGIGSNLAAMGIEVYENIVTCTNNMAFNFLDHRGGMALIYNNIVNTAALVSLNVREEYNDDENPPETSSDGETQHVCRSYYWNNLKVAALVDPSITGTVDYGGEIGLVPQWDVDCWKETTPFTGASGMGVGLLAARPSSGLTVGVGYWATDTNTLYRATGASTWEVFYTSYTYPHPLRGEGKLAMIFH